MAQLGYVTGVFAISLGFAIVAKWIAQLLRAKIHVRYAIAGAGAFVPSILIFRIGELAPGDLLGALLAAGVVFWWFRRDQAIQSRGQQSAVNK